MNSPNAPAPLTLPIDSLRQWTPRLWTLRLPRPPALQFVPGQYVRLALPDPADASQSVWRAYSIVSAPADPGLEFLVSLIDGGPFSTALQPCLPGDTVQLDPRPQGFFIESQLAAGLSLWLLATGSGVGPYLSMLREGSLLQRWRHVVVVHSVRHAAELAPSTEIAALAAADPRLHWLPVVTRDNGAGSLAQRIPHLVDSGALEATTGLPLTSDQARVMVCGNPAFARDMRQLLTQRQFVPCRRGAGGSMLFEQYWQPRTPGQAPSR